MGEVVARDETPSDEPGLDDEFDPGDELEPGDLLFFPGHVALSLGGAAFVHASGSAGEVVENSLDTDHDRYDEDLRDGFELATRLA
jgi:cell wall-associated NlpC family hydrolase